MISKSVRIDLNDISSVTKAIAELNDFSSKLAENTDALAMRCADYMQEEAKIGYDKAAKDWSFNVSVDTKKHKHTAHVIASGEDLLFAEFGTGTATDKFHEWADDFDDVFVGSWSMSEKGSNQFASKVFWYFHKVRFEYTNPTRAMLNAFDKTLQNIEKIAEGVFK